MQGQTQKIHVVVGTGVPDCPNNETIYERRNLIVKKATKTLFSPRKGRIVAELHALFIKYCICISFLFADSRRGSPKASFRAFGGSRRGRLSLQYIRSLLRQNIGILNCLLSCRYEDVQCTPLLPCFN